MEHIDGLDFTILKFRLQVKPEADLIIYVRRVGDGQDTTKITSIWFVKKEDFCGTKELRSR